MRADQLPLAPDKYSGPFFNQLLATLRRYLGQAVSKDEETHRIILRSPNGTNYDVTVTDLGALVVTQTEKTRA
jgi:hypothetical protein